MKKVIGSVALGLALLGCMGQKTEMRSAEAAPAAKASIEASEGGNGNTKLEVKVEHLAPPESVAQDASVYVVWAKPRTGEAMEQNLGALRVDTDRKGKLTTVTPLRSFDVLVTPEASPQATRPSHDPVLTGKVER